jgi:hypothetical protein
MPSFFVGMFALAGVAAAAGPILVHLMNRRRFRTVDWAAMQFLREAVRQSRRVLHVRDLILLLLRVSCLLLFGLAMARPYFSSTGGSFGAGEPIHAVLLVDDSLSMSYRSTQGSVLDEAKAKCKAFIESLPSGSRVAIVPVCADPSRYSLDPAASKQAAIEALDAVEAVDRKAGLNAALDLAQAALRRLPDMPNKRVVFVTDGQRNNFPAEEATKRLADEASGLGGDVQVMTLAAGPTDNAWISELRAIDGAAVAGADTEFLAVVRYEGAAQRKDVQVSFTVDGKLMDTRVVDLEPNQRRELLFTHKFETAPTAEGPRSAVVEASISEDRLPDDNVRQTVVPLMAGLSILYVSEHGPSGSDGNRAESAAGRGLWIQRLLAPIVERGDIRPKLVKITHIPFVALTAEQLQDARMVVLAGVRTPGDRVPLLREYVEQGGRLIITAGEEFDPSAWHDGAWLDGAGILPAPLAPKPLNVADRQAGKPMRLDMRSLGHKYFQIEDAAADELTDLYSAPLFMAAIVADPSPDAVAKLTATETTRIVKRREADKAATAARHATPKPGEEPPPPPPPPLVRLTWPEPPADQDQNRTPEELAARTAPTVIGRLDSGTVAAGGTPGPGIPLFIERNVGRGTILFCSTGLQSSWSTLTLSRAVIVLDRAVRTLLERTLPQRNFDTSQTALLPLRPPGSGTYLQLIRPGDRREPIVVDALGEDKYAVVLRDLAARGVYRIVAQQTDTGTSGDVSEKTLWELPLAVTGPEPESHLASLAPDAAIPGIEAAHVRRLSRSEDLSVAGATVSGRNLWKWLMLLVLICLLAELAVIRFVRPPARAALPLREAAA